MTAKTKTLSAEPTREQVANRLLLAHSTDFIIELSLDSQRAGTVTSVANKEERGTWRVLRKSGETRPYIQIRVDDHVRNVDDLSHSGFITAVRASFDAPRSSTPVALVESGADGKASALQKFKATMLQPNEADQVWTFDAESKENAANTVTGTVHFLRGDLRLPFHVELVDHEKNCGKLLLSVDKHDPVRIMNHDDAIEAAYEEYDLHLPNARTHLLIYDQVVADLQFYTLHIGTRISRLAKATNGLYVNSVFDGSDAEVRAKEKALDAFQARFFEKHSSKSRYAGNEIKLASSDTAPRKWAFDVITVTGFLP